jgi:hypothetical protein
MPTRQCGGTLPLASKEGGRDAHQTCVYDFDLARHREAQRVNAKLPVVGLPPSLLFLIGHGVLTRLNAFCLTRLWLTRDRNNQRDRVRPG